MAADMIIDRDGTKRPVIHGPEAFAAMRKAGRLAEVLDFVTPHVRHGVSTGHLDRLIDGFMREHGRCRRLGYRGYPKSSCISVNHVVNHGIPSEDSGCARGTSPTSTSPSCWRAGTATPAACSWSATACR